MPTGCAPIDRPARRNWAAERTDPRASGRSGGRRRAAADEAVVAAGGQPLERLGAPVAPAQAHPGRGRAPQPEVQARVVARLVARAGLALLAQPASSRLDRHPAADPVAVAGPVAE